MKDSRRSSSTCTESLFLHVVKHNLHFLFLFLFFPIWLFFHEYSRFTEQQVKGEAISLYPCCHFQPLHRCLAGLLLQRAHRCPQLAAGIEHGTFGTRSLEFTLSTLALVAAVVRKMLKTRVTLGNIFCLIKSN